MWNGSRGKKSSFCPAEKGLKEYDLPWREGMWIFKGSKEKVASFSLQIGSLHSHSNFVRCVGYAV